MSSVRSKFLRGDWYNANRLDVANPSMFGTRDTAFHDDIKARTSGGYSGKDVPGLEGEVDTCLAELKSLLRYKYLSKQEGETRRVDFARVVQYFAVDVIGRIGFGTEFGNLKADADVTGYIAAMDVFAPVLTLCADVPWLRTVFLSERMIKRIGPKSTDKQGPGRILGVAKEEVGKRFEAMNKGEHGKYQDMLSSFLRHGLTKLQCEAEATLQLAAGSDTTTNVMRSLMLYIATTPSVYRRLQGEIDDAVARNIVASPIRYAQALQLPYLQAVVYEAIRIHPPNFLLACKEVPAGGETLDGIFVPGGTDIAQNSWSLLRNQDIFGQDSDVFRPERWLSVDGEKRQEMERVTELLFGYGRWQCPGKQIAFLELSKLLFELFRDFDFQIINPKTPWVEKQFGIFLINSMWMRVTERSHKR